MATKVQAATLINTVKYQTDRASLKRVRADLKNLKTQFSKTMAANMAGSPAAARSAVRSARKTAEMMVDSHVKAFNDVTKGKAKQQARNTQNRLNDMFGIGKQAKSARDSANVFKALWASESEVAKRQTEAMNQFADRRKKFQKDIDSLRNTVLSQRAKDEKRDNRIGVNSNRFAYELSRMNLRNSSITALTRDLERLNDRFRQGAISVEQWRESSRQLIRTAKDESKEFRTLGQRLKELREGGNGGLGAGGRFLGLGLAAAIGAGYAATNATREALAGGIDTSRGLQKVQSMGMTPEEAQALRKTIRDRTGFDLSYEKIADISKDTQDKIGQLSQGQWKQSKDGSWAFSGGGEMADWLKIMTTRGGYGRDEAVQTLRNVRGPAELAVLLQSLRKSANLTDSEFVALAEAINDFSYVANAAGDQGKNFTDTLKQMVDNGSLLNKADRDRLAQLSQLSSSFQAMQEGFQGKFGAAFVEGFGLTAQQLETELGKLTPTVQRFGEIMGTLTNWLLKTLNFLFDDYSDGPTTAGGNLRADSWLGRTWDILSGGTPMQSSSPFNTSDMPSWMQKPANGGWNPYGTQQQGPQQPIVVTPAPVNVQVQPSSEFGNLLQAHMDDRIGYAFDDHIFDINNSTLRE